MTRCGVTTLMGSPCRLISTTGHRKPDLRTRNAMRQCAGDHPRTALAKKGILVLDARRVHRWSVGSRYLGGRGAFRPRALPRAHWMAESIHTAIWRKLGEAKRSGRTQHISF